MTPPPHELTVDLHDEPTQRAGWMVFTALDGSLLDARIAPAAGPEGWAKAIDEISDSLASQVGSA